MQTKGSTTMNQPSHTGSVPPHPASCVQLPKWDAAPWLSAHENSTFRNTKHRFPQIFGFSSNGTPRSFHSTHFAAEQSLGSTTAKRHKTDPLWEKVMLLQVLRNSENTGRKTSHGTLTKTESEERYANTVKINPKTTIY